MVSFLATTRRLGTACATGFNLKFKAGGGRLLGSALAPLEGTVDDATLRRLWAAVTALV